MTATQTNTNSGPFVVKRYETFEYAMFKASVSNLEKGIIDNTMKLLLLGLMAYYSEDFLKTCKQIIHKVDIEYKTFKDAVILLYKSTSLTYADVSNILKTSNIESMKAVIKAIENYYSRFKPAEFVDYYTVYQKYIKISKETNTIEDGYNLIRGHIEYIYKRLMFLFDSNFEYKTSDEVLGNLLIKSTLRVFNSNSVMNLIDNVPIRTKKEAIKQLRDETYQSLDDNPKSIEKADILIKLLHNLYHVLRSHAKPKPIDEIPRNIF